MKFQGIIAILFLEINAQNSVWKEDKEINTRTKLKEEMMEIITWVSNKNKRTNQQRPMKIKKKYNNQKDENKEIREKNFAVE